MLLPDSDNPIMMQRCKSARCASRNHSALDLYPSLATAFSMASFSSGLTHTRNSVMPSCPGPRPPPVFAEVLHLVGNCSLSERSRSSSKYRSDGEQMNKSHRAFMPSTVGRGSSCLHETDHYAVCSFRQAACHVFLRQSGANSHAADVVFRHPHTLPSSSK